MGITLALFGSFLCYGASKYFPDSLPLAKRFIRAHKKACTTLGAVLLLLSLVRFGMVNGYATGPIMFATILFLIFSALVIALSVHKNFIYLFIAIALGDVLNTLLF
ncbi:hypothetical protein [Maribacter sp. 2-571]|uniref:hypothetical protein n=1 Tax=Maribacter sp. 2-571 TaxID=3417569 RepID=UPI003D3324F3